MNLPNKLSLFRILLVPVFVAFFFVQNNVLSVLCPIVFLVATLTDFLDGYIARKYNLVTDLGKLLDPIADKVLVTSALFCITAVGFKYGNILYPQCSSIQTQYSWIFAICGSIILARELLVDAVRMIAASKGMVVQANIFGKIKTVLQDVALIVIVVSYKYSFINFDTQAIIGQIGCILLYIATAMTIVSGVIYLIQNKKVFTEK